MFGAAAPPGEAGTSFGDTGEASLMTLKEDLEDCECGV